MNRSLRAGVVLSAFAALGCGSVLAADCTSHMDCDDGRFCNGPELCRPTDSKRDARGCVAGTPTCIQGFACDEGQMRCMGPCDVGGDADGDGHDSFACGGADCDDNNANVFPGNREVCDADNLDEDCDPSTYGQSSDDKDKDGYIDARCIGSLR